MWSHVILFHSTMLYLTISSESISIKKYKDISDFLIVLLDDIEYSDINKTFLSLYSTYDSRNDLSQQYHLVRPIHKEHICCQ